MMLKTLPIIASNATTAFSANLLRRIAKLFSQFFKVPSSFGGEDSEVVGSSSKIPVIAGTIIEIIRGSKY